MRKSRIFCLAAMVWSAFALTLAAAEQRKPISPASPALEERRLAPGQVQVAPEERNKVVVRRVFDDLFSRGRYEIINKIYTEDCLVHHGGKRSRLEEAVAEGKGWRQAAPDLLMTVDEMSSRGDKVIVAWTARGTHRGQGNGLRPSGKHFLIRGRSEFRLAYGKIAEVWNTYDRDDLFRQIGVNPKLGRLLDIGQDLWLSVNRILTHEVPHEYSISVSLHY